MEVDLWWVSEWVEKIEDRLGQQLFCIHFSKMISRKLNIIVHQGNRTNNKGPHSVVLLIFGNGWTNQCSWRYPVQKEQQAAIKPRISSFAMNPVDYEFVTTFNSVRSLSLELRSDHHQPTTISSTWNHAVEEELETIFWAGLFICL